MNSLKDKVALITGGTSGMGAATAKLFHAEGARVIVTGSSDASVAAVRKTMPYVEAIACDAGDPKLAKALVDHVSKEYGRIDILFVNAGIARIAPLAAADEAHFDQLFRVNVRGPYFLIKHAAPVLSDGGSINPHIFHRRGAGNASAERLRSHQSGPALLRAQPGRGARAASNSGQHHYPRAHQHSDQPKNGPESRTDRGLRANGDEWPVGPCG
jgi:NAD(P)-dependent dehydrogenase (short-subunit alcohol dehydrogenase family)